MTYHIGQRFRLEEGYFRGNEYILALGNDFTLQLTDLNSGELWHGGIRIGNCLEITEEEFRDVCGQRLSCFTEIVEQKDKKEKCHCKKILIPEIVPEISVGFRYKGSTILCYVQVKGKLRIGVAACSETDSFNPRIGEKIALRRALGQHKLCNMVRRALWEQYLYTKGIKAEHSILAFFKNHVSFNI